MLNFKKSKIDGFPSSAIFSEDHKYRYALSRDWKNDGPVVAWIMLNPSIGDEVQLERTTQGCMKRSQQWGYGGMIVLNLFAMIETNPDKLKASIGPIGVLNDIFINGITHSLTDEDMIVAAWGNHGKHMSRDQEVVNMLLDKDLYCLGANKDGSPRHPLHLSHSIVPELWRAKQ